MSWRLMLCGLAVAAAVPAAAFAQVGDTIYVQRGSPIRGTVSAMSPDEVTVDSPAGQRKVDVNDIKYIVYQDEPNGLTAGRTAVVQKNFNQAVNDLKAATSDREVIKQDIAFYRALALAKLAMGEGGDKAAAEAAMKAFAGAGRGSYHFYEAAETLGDLAMTSGKYEDAAKYYRPIIANGGKHPEAQLRARLANGRALEGLKKYDEAIAAYKEVTDAGNASPEAKTLAEVGQASCMAATGKAAEAIKMLEGVIEKNDPQDSDLFAKTYVALGNAYQKADKPKEALMAYLHVDMLYYAEADAHAESLFHLSKLWDKVNRADRAIAARNTLRERYNGSVWAQ